MRELSLFSGAGGGLLATKHLLGWQTLGYVEWNEYCQKVIAARIRDGLLDDAPIFGDIEKFLADGYAEAYQDMVDVVSGGFPCQNISAAGNGAGIDGEQSGLWREMASVIGIVRPRYAFVENSPMLASRGLGRVLGDLAALGFDARWGVLAASQVGAWHKRERIWIVAHNPLNRCGQGRPWRSDSGDTRESKQSFQAFAYPHGKPEEWIAKSRQECVPWAVEPDLDRVVPGVPNGMDRVKALGNSQVPIVAATAWRILSGLNP